MDGRCLLRACKFTFGLETRERVDQRIANQDVALPGNIIIIIIMNENSWAGTGTGATICT